MRVQELIDNLVAYSLQNPMNGGAEVMLRDHDGACWGFGQAQDLRGVGGQHVLAFVPHYEGGSVKVKEFVGAKV